MDSLEVNIEADQEQPVQYASRPGCGCWFRLFSLLVISGCLIVVAALLSGFFAGRRSLTTANQERTYHLFVPSSYSAGQPVPLLLAFHPHNGFGWLMQEMTGLNALAERKGFIVAYPDGMGRGWADGSGRSEADQTGVDDVAFTRALIDSLAAQYTIDLSRVYAAGFSNGGFMALRLGCQLSDRIAAVAAVSATMAESVQQTCNPVRPVPVLMMHGTADEDLPLDGKPGLASVPEALLTWVRINGCDFVPLVEHLDPAADDTSVRLETYIACVNDLEVRYYAIDGGGHRWPGGSALWQFGSITQDVNASEVIWSFFDSYAREPF